MPNRPTKLKRRPIANSLIFFLFQAFAVSTLFLSTFAFSVPEHSMLRSSFEFTCETTEDDFYDWIEAELWPMSAVEAAAIAFGRNLDATFDILTDEISRRANWEITLSSVDCQMDPSTDLRRESLFETIEDAHAAGHGLVLRRR